MTSSAAAIAPVAAGPASLPASVCRLPDIEVQPLVLSLMQVDDPCLITKHPPLIKLAVRWLLTAEARSRAVIITGEPGTGRRFFAHCLHQFYDYPGRPLIEVDCASLPPDRAREVIFGSNAPGAFAQAQGGDLVLAHLDCLPVSLLDELATHPCCEPSFTTAGKLVGPSVLLIGTITCPAAKTPPADLASTALACSFAAHVIHLPSLRQRREDIPALAVHFADQAARLCDRRSVHLTPDALARLQTLDWPGNVGQLQRTIEHAVIRTSRQVIDADAFDHLPPVDELFEGFDHDLPALRRIALPATNASASTDPRSGSPCSRKEPRP